MFDKVVRYSLNEEREYFLESDMDLSREKIREINGLIPKE
jgi:hypothetical protein